MDRFAFVVVMLAACSSEPATAEKIFDACAPIRLDASGATDAQLGSVDRATALWRAVGVSTASRDAIGDQVVTVVFESASPASYGYYQDGVVYINVDLRDDDARAVTIAHELGHAFGLVHVAPAERASVMNPGNLTTVPTDDDTRAIRAVSGLCN